MNRKLFCSSIILICATVHSWSQEFHVTFDDETLPAKKDTNAININNPEGNDAIRMQIIQKARIYLGINYIYGQSNGQGFDCSGFVRFVYGQFSYTLPHSSYEQYKMTQHVKTRKAMPGDLVFFVTRGRQISHVGIYLGDNTFIHSPGRGKKVCIDSLNADYYKKRLAGFGKVL